jgi:tRNA threonylcarbamoyladenosine biosynthesis protein TsaB
LRWAVGRRSDAVIVLGIDTVGRSAGVALTGPAGPAARELGEQGRHAERLLPAVLELFEEARLDWSAVQLLAVDEGPGSFTGLRVGVSFALGVGDARGIPVAGLGCLDILARACYDATRPATGTYVFPAVDVRRGEVVLGRFRIGPGGPVREGGDRLLSVGSLGDPPPPGALVAGEEARSLWPDAELLRWEGSGRDRALAACLLGGEKMVSGTLLPPAPRYARPPGAKPRRSRLP